MQITIHPEVLTEFEYIVQLHKQHGAPNPMQSVEQLVSFVLASVADGSRRPGCWERGMLEQMGLIADSDEHAQYRAHYGPVMDLELRAAQQLKHAIGQLKKSRKRGAVSVDVFQDLKDQEG